MFDAMSSALQALGSTIYKEAGKGVPDNVLIEGEEGNIYLLRAGLSLVLTVLTGANPNLGLTLTMTRRVAGKLAGLA